MRARVVAVALIASLPAAAALAQDTPFTAQSGSRPIIRPDGTYILNHLPNSDLVFEGHIAPRIVIMDSIGDATRRVLDSSRQAVWGWQLSTTPMVKLRMFHEASNPVRTPSYMPKGTLQFVRLENLTASRNNEEDAFNRGPIGMWLVDVIPFGHHSNGQDGCLFTSQSQDADGTCVESGLTPPGLVNKIDGSFSTNYIEATVHYGRLHLDSVDAPDTEYATRWEWRIGGGVQVNPKGFLGGAIDHELADLYGRTRILVDAMAARRDVWRCGRAEADVRIQYLHDTPAGLPDAITRIEGSCLPRRWGGAGLFVRLYHGQDYYNLGFAESITRLQFGLILQQDSFLSFRIR
jgi:hypothetical protein